MVQFITKIDALEKSVSCFSASKALYRIIMRIFQGAFLAVCDVLKVKA
jgi:hypothetical protein